MLFPRRVMVCKTGRSPVPFKFLIWLCYRVRTARASITCCPRPLGGNLLPL